MVDNNLLAIVVDLRYCPICAWSLDTEFQSHGVIARKCPNHGRVFVIRPYLVRTGDTNNWDIETNLGDG